MPAASARRLLAELAQLKNQFGRTQARRVLATLKQLDQTTITDAELLGEFHEILLFLRAYPHSATIVRITEAQLRTFAERTALLLDRD